MSCCCASCCDRCQYFFAPHLQYFGLQPSHVYRASVVFCLQYFGLQPSHVERPLSLACNISGGRCLLRPRPSHVDRPLSFASASVSRRLPVVFSRLCLRARLLLCCMVGGGGRSVPVRAQLLTCAVARWLRHRLSDLPSMPFSHFTDRELELVRAFKVEGRRPAEIAELLGWHISTIVRHFQRLSRGRAAKRQPTGRPPGLTQRSGL